MRTGLYLRSFAFIPAILCLCVVARAQSVEPLKLARFALTIGPGRGSAVIGWKVTALNRGARVGIQLFLERKDATGRIQWDTVAPESPEGPVILTLDRGKECGGTFTIPLEKGAFGGCRIMLFNSPDGKSVDYGATLYDSAADPATAGIRLDFVSTGEKRLLNPVLTLSEPTVTAGAGGYTVTVCGEVLMPSDQLAAGFSAVAESESGLRRVSISSFDALSSEPGAAAKRIPVRWVYDGVRPGVWGVRAGISRAGGDVRWATGRIEVEVGGESWLAPANAGAVTLPRVRLRAGRFETTDGASFNAYADMPGAQGAAGFVRGGNFGNAVCWTATPALNQPAYFRQLRALGCRFVRVNYSADRYLEQAYYPRVIEQVVRNIWAGGLYPLLAPQELPKGRTDAERVQKLTQVLEQVATRHKGQPVWLEVLNEPSAFPTWSAWKPVASRLARTIRAIDPDAFVVVPFESWAKDGRSAAASPITDVRVDLYDGHAYLKPEEIAEHFAPAIRAGLPVLLGEFGGGPDYLRQILSAIDKLPRGLMAIAPWAFTIPGQDSIPLVAECGETGLKFTAAGQVVASAFREWNAGRHVAR